MSSFFFLLYVYDVVILHYSDRKSFEDTEKWIQQVQHARDGVILSLVGNKSDLEEDRVIPIEEAQSKAENLNILYTEVSAKSGFQIENLFEQIAQLLPTESTFSPPESNGHNNIISWEETTPKSRCAC